MSFHILDTHLRLFSGRFDSLAHDPTALGFINERLPMQRPGKMGVGGGGFVLGLEMVDALLEEGAGCLVSFEDGSDKMVSPHWASV